MTIEYRNARQLELGGFDCEINHPDFGWIPTTIDADDTGNPNIDMAALHAKITADAGFVAYVAPSDEEVSAKNAAAAREVRDELLIQEVDPIVSNPLRWADMPEATQTAWSTYRQALLDVPQQSGFPNTITWPTPPSE